MKLSKLKPLLVHTAISTAVAYIPAVAQILNPVATVALSVATYAITKFFEKKQPNKHEYTKAERTLMISNQQIAKDVILLGISLPILGFTGGIVGLAAAHLAGHLTHRAMLWIKPPKEYLDY